MTDFITNLFNNKTSKSEIHYENINEDLKCGIQLQSKRKHLIKSLAKNTNLIEGFSNSFPLQTLDQVDFNEIETEEALLILEKSKIKSAIITDFILSLEIIMIALGTVTNYSLLIQVAVVSLVAIIATIGVYGMVALMVRIDDIGFRLIKISENKKGFVKTIFYKTGTGLVWVLPKLIQLIAIIGTLAMLLVGGGLFVHNIPSIHDFFHFLPNIISELIVGLTVGFIAYLLWKGLMIITQWKS